MFAYSYMLSMIDRLILTVSQPVKGYFIPRSKGITFLHMVQSKANQFQTDLFDP